MKRKMIGLSILLTLAIAGCDDSFNPKASFQPRMVIYSVLNAESDTQFVRIYSSYDSPDNDPLKNLVEKPVTDASVTITDGVRTYNLRDTVIQRPEKDRYQSDIHAYYAYPFRPKRDRTYKLVVFSGEHGASEATLTVPGRGEILILNPSVVDSPWDSDDPSVNVQVDISPNTKGVRVILVVEYEVLGAHGWEVRRREVPVSMVIVDRQLLQYAVTWPEVVGRLAEAGVRGVQLQSFGRFAYRRTLEMICASSSYDMRFKNAIIYLVQFDENLYRNYQTANGFKDRYSIRLDERDFTNIKNGLGVFGCYTVDSLYFELRPGMRPRGDPNPFY
jgi:hypothetical protein